MNSVTHGIPVELTPDMAQELLPIMKKRRAQIAEELAQMDAQIGKIASSLRSTSDEDDEAAVIEVPDEQNSTNGRLKRGAGIVVVGEYLQGKNGEGSTIGEILTSTGLNYGTARRALRALKKEKKIRSYGGTFRWIVQQAT
jgi:hypothetical protein